ncbi:acyl-CoA Delta-9 desaturase-like [Pectinophora gossypiella]|uniref:acyl-CoA Delta-9 desaturase-like n=1 Tax=Pectinophora gossypiella TaxID=13191 RepID=UPI00214E0FEC|nr:acyl-CoA Delta-9 desaturase-like [Pectinophora gossypiella]XP_049868597.1 acyl-CoA Delta-9 desaturase-like [Pectinophora gossypiella]XP_049868598.1 acyl-CoA Delta-9 desaturase-like [Pectinophora gossypiella]
MSPQMEASWALYESDIAGGKIPVVPASAKIREWHIVWKNVIIYTLLHIAAVYGGYLFFFEAKWATCAFAYMLYIMSGLGITAGVHRLWSHKAYKANLPLRVILALFNTIAFQDAVLHWARDHRMHHKYSETDADPHNATRGFFFSHVGWLMVKKHPEIKAKAHTIDISDLLADPVLTFQKKYYFILMPLCCFILPTIIPTLWGESIWNGFFVAAIFRFIYVLNVTWLVNSAAHMFGSKPYDKNIKPVENKTLSVLVLGEGFHNFHHTFPWDYKSSELGDYSLNFTNLFLDIMTSIGWAYDLKSVSREAIRNRVKRTGDGSHDVWGWDDKDVPTEHKEMTTIINPSKIE